MPGRIGLGHSRGTRTEARLGWVLLVLSVGLIAIATLTPLRGGGGGNPDLCVVCGVRGLADLVANFLLFLPFGVALGLVGVRKRYALLMGVAFTLGIEAAQVWVISGRDASAADVLSNSAAAVIGAGLGRSWSFWLNPPGRWARGLLVSAAAVALGIIALTGVLFQPLLPDRQYYGQLTESPGVYQRYEGEVLQTRIGGDVIPPRSGPLPDRVRNAMQAGDSLLVQLRMGPPPSRFAHVLAIVDGPWEVLLLGAEENDLILRFRGRSFYYYLDQPTVRLIGALEGRAVGDAINVRIWRGRTGFCLATDSASACPAFTLASGWALFQQIDAYPRSFQVLLNMGWAAFLAFPLGLWFRRDLISRIVTAVVLAGASVIPLFVDLVPPRPLDIVGAIFGWVAGAAIYWWIGRSKARRGEVVIPAEAGIKARG